MAGNHTLHPLQKKKNSNNHKQNTALYFISLQMKCIIAACDVQNYIYYLYIYIYIYGHLADATWQFY